MTEGDVDPIEAFERELLARSVRKLATDPEMRPLLRWIFDAAHVYRLSTVGECGTDFHEGERNVGLSLISLMENVDPTLYPAFLLDEARR